jgi:hypothetical protein
MLLNVNSLSQESEMIFKHTYVLVHFLASIEDVNQGKAVRGTSEDCEMKYGTSAVNNPKSFLTVPANCSEGRGHTCTCECPYWTYGLPIDNLN